MILLFQSRSCRVPRMARCIEARAGVGMKHRASPLQSQPLDTIAARSLGAKGEHVILWKSVHAECRASRGVLRHARPSEQPIRPANDRRPQRSDEHTSELQSLMRISDAVFRM